MTGDMERCRLGEMPRQARLDDQRGTVVRGRKVFCRVAVRKLGYTGALVARFLGMTTPSVNLMARLEEMTELDTGDK